jgi:formylglycine-generating enzyme required for sulfatase activity
VFPTGVFSGLARLRLQELQTRAPSPPEVAEPSMAPLVDPAQAESARVLRGGSWGGRPWGLRSAYRSGGTADYRLTDLGFRLARSN